jgi:hypothetical protein
MGFIKAFRRKLPFNSIAAAKGGKRDAIRYAVHKSFCAVVPRRRDVRH